MSKHAGGVAPPKRAAPPKGGPKKSSNTMGNGDTKKSGGGTRGGGGKGGGGGGKSPHSAPPPPPPPPANRKERKQLSEQRKLATKKHYGTIAETVRLWEAARPRANSAEQRAKLAEDVARRFLGKSPDLATHHSASRVLQFVLRELPAGSKLRASLVAEVRAAAVPLARSKYGKHVVQRMVAAHAQQQGQGQQQRGGGAGGGGGKGELDGERAMKIWGGGGGGVLFFSFFVPRVAALRVCVRVAALLCRGCTLDNYTALSF
jgi:hypothetical protein